MRWMKTGRQLGQAVKNVQRLGQVIAVFKKYGFMDILDRMNLGKFLPNKKSVHAEAMAEYSPQKRLRLAFEELGPTFVKLGQLLSTRSDLLPESYIEEFTHLQDRVQPLSFDVVRSVIESELNKKLEDAFLDFKKEPLAAASIAQVHEAVLLSGEKVVVKVQRPEIDKMIETDVSLLAFMASLLEKYVPETRIIGPSTIVEEFFQTLNYELDFVVEANNIKKITENTADTPEIVLPKVYKHLSTHRILTLEKFEGIRVNDLKALDAAGIDRKKIVEIGARTFFKWVMMDGLFHGDLHGGNLFILPGDRLGIIDFGIVGRLSQKSRDQLTNMVISLITEDYENLCYEYAELGAAGVSIDFEGFQREVRNTLSPYMGLSISEINVGRILIEATQIATQYNIKVPGDWMLVFKAILTIEGMGRTLDPEFDLLQIGQSLLKDLIKNQYSVQRLSKEFTWIAKDSAQLLKILPRQIRWMFRKLNSNDFAFEIKSQDLQDVRWQLDLNNRRMTLGLLCAGLFIASSLSMTVESGRTIWGYPLFAMIYFGLASLLLFLIFLGLIRKQ
ncbi:AarF/ABC1/UbiB kinase family protein [bacterium]|jgi:ubiquinone biosynthesis protein|nr:AarF/ABC1/UbiB kinase family protein [bacterium]